MQAGKGKRMDKKRKLLNTAESFCRAWFEKLDIEQAVRFLSEDVSFVGTGEDEKAFGREEVRSEERRVGKECTG